MKKINYIFLVFILFAFSSCSNSEQIDVGNMILSPLSDKEISGLNLALEDEYRAEATYAKVISQFGEVNPFANIVNAEVKHSTRLIQIFEDYNIEYPQNEFYGIIDDFESISDACQVGVQAEIENINLYTELFESTDKENILVVYRSLQKASQEKHLVAFERCS